MASNRDRRDQSARILTDLRRSRIAAFMARKMPVREIIIELSKEKLDNPETGKPWGLATIQKDIEALRIQWRAEALASVDEWKGSELATITEVEREAWRSWAKSKETKQQTKTERATGRAGGNIDKASVVTENPDGDPRFLLLVLQCSTQRSKLLGLDAPEEHIVHPVPEKQKLDVSNLTEEQILALDDLLWQSSISDNEVIGDKETIEVKDITAEVNHATE